MLIHEISNKRSRVRAPQKSRLLIFDTEMRKEPFENGSQTATPIGVALQKGKTCIYVLYHLAEKFGKRTTIHGVDRLVNRKTGKMERILWSIAFAIALVMLIYVILIIAARYNRKQFTTVIGTTTYPVYKIPFPELTICNRNRLNWERLHEAKRRFLQEIHHTTEHEALFTRVITRYDTLQFGQFDQFANLTGRALETLNYVNFTLVVEFMAWRCHEILANCTWRRESYNCCSIFFPRKSQVGSCLAFNSIESEEGRRMQMLDPHWPWRYGRYGPGSGLTLNVLLRLGQHSPYSANDKGIMFVATEPFVWFSFPIYISIHTRASISIDAIMHFYDNHTRSVRSDQRECVFEDEQNSKDFKTLQGQKYMFENCQAECQQEYLMHFCNCTFDLFYPAGPYPPCKLVDLPCLAQHNNRLLYFEQTGEGNYVYSNVSGMECKCFLNCYSLSYITDVRSMLMKEEERVANKSIVELDFYFRRSTILVYKTTLVFTWVDLLVSFGGIACLFLGCSVLSLVELGYFLAVDMPKWLWKEHNNKRGLNSKSLKVRESVTKLLEEGGKYSRKDFPSKERTLAKP